MLTNVLYMLPMLLGRTFDARNDRVGIDIFPQEELDRARWTQEPQSVSRYEITDSSDEIRDLIEVTADMALKIKAGKVDFKGTGSYLKDTSKMGRVIEILTRLKFKTETVALPLDVKAFPTWTRKNRNDLGTHYVRSITYGGELLASLRFKVNKDTDFNYINAEIESSFKGGDTASLVAEGRLESLQSRLKDKASMEISYYATVPLKDVPNTIDGLRSLVKGFDQHVKEVNNGRGVPIRVELMELTSLGGVNASRFQFLKDRALENELSDFEKEFDDLRRANAMLIDWYRSLPASIPQEQEAQINKLMVRIQKVMRPYYKTIGRLNIEEPPEKQLKEAREAFQEGKASARPGKFTKEFYKLKQKIVITEKKLYGTGSGTYYHWGSKECPGSPMIYQLHTGRMVANTNRGTGGASEYLCLPNETNLPEENPAFGNDNSVYIGGVKYGSMDEHPFDEPEARYYFGKGVPCSMCHMTNRTLVHTFPATSECPENWITEYYGYMMAGSNLPGIYFCMDISPEAYDEIPEEQQAHTLSIVHIEDQEGGLSKPPYVKNAAIACVVCSI